MSLIEPPSTRQTHEPEPRRPQPPPRVPVQPVLITMALLMVAIEAAQVLESMKMFPAIFDRVLVYSAFAFFDVSFDRALAGEGITAQLLWSLVTHAFLHGGWLHLGLNLAAFLGLGHAISRAIGIGRLVAAFVICAVAGAITLGLISDVRGPLVGASGAIFGFLAMITAWQERVLAAGGYSRRPIWARIAGLVAINVILAVGLGGLLAWEAHLGGFVAGWILGLLWRPQIARVRLPL